MRPVLVNKSDQTLFVNQCEITEDTGTKFVVTPFALQRWNQKTKSWDTVAAHTFDYCRSGGWLQARTIRTAVTPGQRLEVTGDFVGAAMPSRMVILHASWSFWMFRETT